MPLTATRRGLSRLVAGDHGAGTGSGAGNHIHGVACVTSDRRVGASAMSRSSCEALGAVSARTAADSGRVRVELSTEQAAAGDLE